MQPLGTKVYLFKWYSPSDSFCTFFLRVCIYIYIKCVFPVRSVQKNKHKERKKSLLSQQGLRKKSPYRTQCNKQPEFILSLLLPFPDLSNGDFSKHL